MNETNRKLKGKIIETYGSLSNFCEDNKISMVTVRRVLRGDRPVCRLERIGWCSVLGIPVGEMDIFFQNKDEIIQP